MNSILVKDDFYKKYGSWALVTGASSGIGEEFSRQLAARKFNLVLVARREDRLKRLADELATAHGIKVNTVSVDLSKPDFMQPIAEVTNALDIGLLINNAGFALTGNFLDHSIDDELSLLYVNCRAPLMLTHAFGKRMAKRGRGGIINVSSASAFLPIPLWTHYAATKVYELYLSDGLWFELKEKGVDVLALCPGGTRTEFSKVAGIKSHGMAPVPVVELALKRLGKKSSVIPGFGNRLTPLIDRILPREWLIKLGSKAVSRMLDRNL